MFRTPSHLVILSAMQQHDGIPTPEEFETARRRELTRLNLRLSSLIEEDYCLASESRAILEGDTLQLEMRDRETVRRWTAAKKVRQGVAS